jgi:CRISPR-associated Csx2 family protein
MTTLISFLGKSRADPATGYRKTRYRFEPGRVEEVPFFGLALTKVLRPGRLVLVGTAGSMWDVFFESGTPAAGEVSVELMEAVQNEAVDDALLHGHAERLAARLGIPVHCLLIGQARTAPEQAELLHRLAGVIGEGEHVTLDVTHSFRHLPMLALVAARYLGRTRRVCVDDIYYGAADMTDPTTGETPVLRLKGLLAMLDWVDALATFDKDGDYSVFERLLAADGLPAKQAALLGEAAFFERTSNSARAKETLSTVEPAIQGHAGALARLFRDQLTQRMGWFRKPTRHQRELALADAYLLRRDPLRCAIFLQEAWISRGLYEAREPDTAYESREQQKEWGRENSRPFRALSQLRNAMAHGVKPGALNRDDIKVLESEAKLIDRLRQLRRELFGG